MEIDSYKQGKEYIKFIGSWIETGIKWYEENPKLITGYKFNHDWNSDCGFKKYKKEILNVPHEIDYVVQSLVSSYIISGSPEKDKVIEWFSSGGVDAIPILSEDLAKNLVYPIKSLIQFLRKMVDGEIKY